MRKNTMHLIRSFLFFALILGLAPGSGVSEADAQVAGEPESLIYQTKEGREVKGATTIDAATAKALFDRGVPFVDVRFNSDFKKWHIPGAIHLHPSFAFDEGALAKIVSKEEEVVIYCAGAG